MSNHSDWIGREATRTETITQRQVDGLAVTLAGTLAPGAVPPGLHWCLVPDMADPQDLGRDGHPKRGMFMPDLPGLPRRMWAGGELAFNAALQTGDTLTRASKIADISFKTGSTGPLGFVTVQNLYAVAGQTRITERQDIVYREDPQTRPSGDARRRRGLARREALAHHTRPGAAVSLLCADFQRSPHPL